MASSRTPPRQAAKPRRPAPAARLGLYDYLPDDTPGKERPEPGVRVRVRDDWPAVPPVTEAEVRLVEAYFGALLDELFGPLP